MNQSNQQLVEVWGDTVDFRSMLFAIVIGAIVSIGVFLLAKEILVQQRVDAKLLNGYAMLIGMGGCLLAGMICSVLFKPKRVVISETQNSQQKTQEIIHEIVSADTTYTKIEHLPIDTQKELELLGLKELFVTVEKNIPPKS